jgi:hypothetical protein
MRAAFFTAGRGSSQDTVRLREFKPDLLGSKVKNETAQLRAVGVALDAKAL